MRGKTSDSIFHTESDTYFPGADFHCSHLHPPASKKYKSTGMTQPPVAGFALYELYKTSKDKESMLATIAPMLNKVYKNHEYFYSNRDLHNEGLVYIYHNWESGTDNSPLWDDIFNTMQSPEFTFERRDTTHVDASQRPSKKEYDHYLNIIDFIFISFSYSIISFHFVFILVILVLFFIVSNCLIFQ